MCRCREGKRKRGNGEGEARTLIGYSWTSDEVFTTCKVGTGVFSAWVRVSKSVQ